MLKINNFNTPHETLSRLTEQLIRYLQLIAPTSSSPRLALSGGETGKQLFNLWSTSYADNPVWHETHYYWIDERCVPPTDDESNFGTAKQLFFNPLNICSKHIYPIHGEIVPQKEACRYTEIVQSQYTPMQNANFVSSSPFHCAILGIGTDGHTASIFSLDKQILLPQKYYVTKHPLTGQSRITASMQLLFNIPCIFIGLTGKKKEWILRNRHQQSVLQHPGTYLLKHHRNIHIFTDSNALPKKLKSVF